MPKVINHLFMFVCEFVGMYSTCVSTYISMCEYVDARACICVCVLDVLVYLCCVHCAHVYVYLCLVCRLVCLFCVYVCACVCVCLCLCILYACNSLYSCILCIHVCVCVHVYRYACA